jgi:SpoVK/Ycf46/Vps4 family AAA+-type ATPase
MQVPMSAARHIIALLKSHIEGDNSRFLTTALQLAAHEARQGHGKLATEVRDLIDAAKSKGSAIERIVAPVPMAQPKGELASILAVRYPDVRLAEMVLPEALLSKLKRVIHEQRQQEHLRAHGLRPSRKLLLVGPPGVGKTMTAAALAGELKLPLFTVVLDGLITKFMGDTAGKLRLVFDAMASTRGVYFFDEFDAIGSKRAEGNDVGEIRRVLNSFLQFLEQDDSQGLIIAATNHAELLDKALFRRFDDVIEYGLPDVALINRIFKNRLAAFDTKALVWDELSEAAMGLSPAEIVRAAENAAKSVLLAGGKSIVSSELVASIVERRKASFLNAT